MSDAKFEKINPSDKALYGPRKLVLCGFAEDVRPKFEKVLEMAGLLDIPRIWAGAGHEGLPLAEIMELPPETIGSDPSALPRAIIVAGIMEKQLHELMSVCKQTGMKQALWAVLTPTSESWSLGQLLTELNAEREAMAKKRR